MTNKKNQKLNKIMSEKDLWLKELNRTHLIDPRDKIHLNNHDQFGDKAVHVTTILCSTEFLSCSA